MRHKFVWSILIIAAAVISGSAAPTNRYVVKDNPNAADPYDTWVNAAPDIQTAIDAAVAANGDAVVVAPATYDSGGMKRQTIRYLTNRVVLNKPIVVRSRDNDPVTTIIKGAWASSGDTNGPDAIRGVYMHAGAQLIGFTITHGATVVTNEVTPPTHTQIGECACGGGIYALSMDNVISNCIITGNAAVGDNANGLGGGGAYQGTYYDCKFISNSVGPSRVLGGGAFDADLYRCQLYGNRALPSGRGGGAFRGTLHSCVVSNNYADFYGGGVAGWSAAMPINVYDSTIVNNTAGINGGGLYDYSSASNCLIADNVAGGAGGGANGSQLTHCQILRNQAMSGGGGVTGCTLTNCLVAYNDSNGTSGGARYVNAWNCLFYGNRGRSAVYLNNGKVLDSCTIVGNNTSGIMTEGATCVATVRNCIVYSNKTANCEEIAGSTIRFTNSCTTPAQSGWDASNTTSNPQFMAFGTDYGTNHVPGDYRLRVASPCVDSGLYQEWMSSARDLDGAPRINYLTGRVDMGCYEHIFSASLIMVR